MDAPATSPLRAGEPVQPGQALGRLAPAALLQRQGRDLVLLVVDDRDRHEVGVVGVLAVGAEGVDEVAQHPHPRRSQLAGAGATPLEVPLEVGVLAQQEPEVEAQHGRVDRVVAGGAADEDQPAPLPELRERPHGEVDPAEGVVAGEPVPGGGRPQDQRVEVGAVVGQEHQRVPTPQLGQLGQPTGIDVDLVGPRQPPTHPVPHPRGGLVHVRRHLRQRSLRVLLEGGCGEPGPVHQAGHGLGVLPRTHHQLHGPTFVIEVTHLRRLAALEAVLPCSPVVVGQFLVREVGGTSQAPGPAVRGGRDYEASRWKTATHSMWCVIGNKFMALSVSAILCDRLRSRGRMRP